MTRLSILFLLAAAVGVGAAPPARAQAMAPSATDYPPYFASPHDAAPPDDRGFHIWLQGVRQDAIKAGIAAPAAFAALRQVTLDDRVIDLDTAQPETTATFGNYSARIDSDQRVEEGRALLRQNAALLRRIGRRYGVAPAIIVALWGIESNYGRNQGGFDTLSALATLAYKGRRPDLFRRELIDALRIIDQRRVPADDLQGSWAGAMGQCQFMPSTYLRYAVDTRNRGYSDIWDNKADVFASIARYLAAEGWKSGGIWGREVRAARGIPDSRVGLGQKHTLAEWSRWGVRKLNGKTLPKPLMQASLIQPDGPGGRSFLVYDNFRALMRWNHSSYFATSVGLLADRISGNK